MKGDLTLEVGVWYNIPMSENKDQTRETIVAKIATKSSASEKLSRKLDTLNETEVVYQNAIEKAEAKIADLKSRIENFAVTRETLVADKAKRDEELEKMEDILRHYDSLMVEGEALGAIMLAKIKEHEWMPGDPEEDRDALERDEVYLKARKRKLEINDWMSDSLGYINRIFYSRGEVD